MEDMDLARLGPMSVKYLQNLSAISIGSVNFLPSDLNDVGRDELLLRQLITSFNNFQVVLRSFLAFSNLESQYFRLEIRVRWVSLFLQALYFVSEDAEGDLTNFLQSLFFLLTDVRIPGLSQGENNLFTCLLLRTFKGKQALQILEYSSIK